jgi:uncharacterized membrane protein
VAQLLDLHESKVQLRRFTSSICEEAVRVAFFLAVFVFALAVVHMLMYTFGQHNNFARDIWLVVAVTAALVAIKRKER